MRPRLLVASLFGCVFFVAAPLAVSAATTTTAPSTTTVSPVVIPVTTTTSSTSTTSTTSTSLPSAVTTVPEGCDLPPVAQAVFVGKVKKLNDASALYVVQQIRAGSLEGYVTEGTVDVRYGRDAKFLRKGTVYIVGVMQDPVTLRLSSSIHDAAKLFGGADVAGSNAVCPTIEDPARTLHSDGTSIDSGIFSQLFDSPWRVVGTFLIGPVTAFLLLFGAVRIRKGLRA